MPLKYQTLLVTSLLEFNVYMEEVQMEPYKYLWKVLCETLSKMVVDGEEVSPGDVLGVMAGMEAEVFDFNLEELRIGTVLWQEEE